VTARHRDIAATLEAVEQVGARAVVDEALDALSAAPRGVLIGGPLAELARREAERVDADSTRLALRGVPFVVKDNIDVAGVPTTAGCPGFAYIARRDAPVVAALREAGAIVVGKANLDQFATGLVGTRSPYGTPPNVLDPGLVPGGSSSGSAAAVALGLVPFALGTDTAGSGRVPAALNGIVGLKPTVGRHDTSGIVPAVRRFDCPSVFALSVADAALVDAAMHPRPAPASVASTREPPIVGYVEAWPDTVQVQATLDDAYRHALDLLASVGAALRPVDITPVLAVGELLYGSAIVAERMIAAGNAIGRGVEGLDPNVTAVIGAGVRFTAVDAYAAEYELADRRRWAEAALTGVDILALPTTPTAPTLADVRADPIGANERLGTFTTFANLLGRPALVVPTGPSVPAGLQLLGAPWADHDLLRVGCRVAAAAPAMR
jgi:allophanate hydrolase